MHCFTQTFSHDRLHGICYLIGVIRFPYLFLFPFPCSIIRTQAKVESVYSCNLNQHLFESVFLVHVAHFSDFFATIFLVRFLELRQNNNKIPLGNIQPQSYHEEKMYCKLVLECQL